jgi:hypothetical protein
MGRVHARSCGCNVPTLQGVFNAEQGNFDGQSLIERQQPCCWFVNCLERLVPSKSVEAPDALALARLWVIVFERF